MTFDEWWLKLKPAECDELKEVFRDCWESANLDGHDSGYDLGYEEGHEQGHNAGYDLGLSECEGED